MTTGSLFFLTVLSAEVTSLELIIVYCLLFKSKVKVNLIKLEEMFPRSSEIYKNGAFS